MRVLTNVLLFGLLFVLTGCFASRPEDIEVFKMPETSVTSADEYLLQPPDEIEVHCTRVPEINMQRQRVRPDGYVTFENIGRIPAAGKTPEQVGDLIRQRVEELYSLPGDKAIDVRITAFQSKVFYIMGEVSVPGPKLYTGRNTVLSAMADAVPTVLAWEQHTQVIRPSSDPEVRPRVFEVDFKDMIERGDTTKNVLIEEGDIIYVPPTVLATIGKFAEELFRPIGSAFSTIYTVQRTGMGGAPGVGF